MADLQTERLSLKPFGPDDAGLKHGLIADLRVFFWRDAPGTLREARQSIASSMALANEQRLGWWAVRRRNDDTFLGQCGLQPLPGTDEIEIGYHFAFEHWGHGYATEAARAVLDHGFRELHLERITAVVLPDNAPSLRVMEKLTMPYIEDRLHAGLTHRFFALSRSDYMAREE